MWKYISKSVFLLAVSVVACCVVYPLALWVVGQTFFQEQANGSMLNGPDGKPVGSRLIAQPFTKDEYFQPRPSACSYDASASASSALSSNNYQLRDRVARTLAPLVNYKSGPKAGQPAAPDVEEWFKKNTYQGKEDIVGQWASAHSALAQAWVKADPKNGAFVDEWSAKHPDIVAQFVKDNPDTSEPKAPDLAVVFFQDYAKEHPGMFPSTVTTTGADGKPVTATQPVNTGPDIQTTFFLMWIEDHPDVELTEVPGDLVTASASGLDPHISMENARFQLDRVAAKWADDLKRDPASMHKQIEAMLEQNADAPWYGLAGEPFVNVLELNLKLRQEYGEPPA